MQFCVESVKVGLVKLHHKLAIGVKEVNQSLKTIESFVVTFSPVTISFCMESNIYVRDVRKKVEGRVST